LHFQFFITFTPMQPLQQLKEMKLQADRIKSPNFPEHARVIPKYSDKTEKGLKQCIVDFCKFTGNHAEPINNRGTRIDNRVVVENCIGQLKTIGSVAWAYSSQQKGTADVSATIKGRSVKIEIKIGKDYQRPAQAAYQKQIESAGGIYIIVKTFDEFYQWYQKFVNIRDLQNAP